MCYLPKSRNVITLVRRINFAYILLYTNFTILVSGSGHSRVTRASYNYDLQSNGSFGHHFFYIKTRSSAEHSKIANRERSKWFSRVFPTRLAFLLLHGTKRNKVILAFAQLNFTWVADKTECTNYGHIHCIVYLVIGRSSQDSYPFTSFAAPMSHANFRALSFIHIVNGRDTIGYSFSTGMLKLAE